MPAALPEWLCTRGDLPGHSASPDDLAAKYHKLQEDSRPGNSTIFDMRQQAKELIAESGSRDLQTIKLTVRMLYQPSPDLNLLVKDVGPDYADKVLPSVGNEARYNASELLTQRNQVSLEIKDLLVNRSALFHTNIMDVSITELSFSPEYTRAVEAKQIAQQNAERAKFEVERAQQEKQSMLVLAEGEAKSALLVGKAVKSDPTYMMLESLKASKHIAELMSHSPNKAYLSSEDLLLPPAGLDPRQK
eukprot:gene2834-3433_t